MINKLRSKWGSEVFVRGQRPNEVRMVANKIIGWHVPVTTQMKEEAEARAKAKRERARAVYAEEERERLSLERDEDIAFAVAAAPILSRIQCGEDCGCGPSRVGTAGIKHRAQGAAAFIMSISDRTNVKPTGLVKSWKSGFSLGDCRSRAAESKVTVREDIKDNFAAAFGPLLVDADVAPALVCCDNCFARIVVAKFDSRFFQANQSTRAKLRVASTVVAVTTQQAPKAVQMPRVPSSVAKQRSPLPADPERDLDVVDESPTLKSVGNILASMKMRKQPRSNVKGDEDTDVRGIALGVLNARVYGVIRSTASEIHPNLTRTLVNLARHAYPDFKFTTIQVNDNYKSCLHIDGNNVGPSLIVGVGDYSGGGLWTLEHGELPVNHRWQEFDGNLPHCTLPFKGTRYTLIYFCHKSFDLLQPGYEERLLGQDGFPLPDNYVFHAGEYEPEKVRLQKGAAALREFEMRRSPSGDKQKRSGRGKKKRRKKAQEKVDLA
jgi:hypothetical protein